jgi:hypothetical protein
MGRSIHVASVVVCISLLGCASVFLQTDDFPDKLKLGCASLESCEALESEAAARVARCKENTIGYIRCDDANADLGVASRLANHWREERRRADEERQIREGNERQERAIAEQQQREKLRESAEIAAHEQRENEQRVREAQAAAVKQAEHDKDVAYIKLLGPSGREQRVRTCVRDYGPATAPRSSCRCRKPSATRRSPRSSPRLRRRRLRRPPPARGRPR